MYPWLQNQVVEEEQNACWSLPQLECDIKLSLMSLWSRVAGSALAILAAELLQELEALVDQIDEATAKEEAATLRAEAAERKISSLQTQLDALQVIKISSHKFDENIFCQ